MLYKRRRFIPAQLRYQILILNINHFIDLIIKVEKVVGVLIDICRIEKMMLRLKFWVFDGSGGAYVSLVLIKGDLIFLKLL